MEGKRRAYQDL